MERWKEILIERAYAATQPGAKLPQMHGICHVLTTLHDDIAGTHLSMDEKYDARGYLFKCFLSWPHYSGNWEYPVPDKRAHPQAAYFDASHTHALWDETTEYGRLRWDLLRHICMELAK